MTEHAGQWFPNDGYGFEAFRSSDGMWVVNNGGYYAIHEDRDIASRMASGGRPGAHFFLHRENRALKEFFAAEVTRSAGEGIQ